jgi:hypothetical protein
MWEKWCSTCKPESSNSARSMRRAHSAAVDSNHLTRIGDELPPVPRVRDRGIARIATGNDRALAMNEDPLARKTPRSERCLEAANGVLSTVSERNPGGAR